MLLVLFTYHNSIENADDIIQKHILPKNWHADQASIVLIALNLRSMVIFLDHEPIIHSSKILTIQQGITRGVNSSVGKPCRP